MVSAFRRMAGKPPKNRLTSAILAAVPSKLKDEKKNKTINGNNKRTERSHLKWAPKTGDIYGSVNYNR